MSDILAAILAAEFSDSSSSSGTSTIKRRFPIAAGEIIEPGSPVALRTDGTIVNYKQKQFEPSNNYNQGGVDKHRTVIDPGSSGGTFPTSDPSIHLNIINIGTTTNNRTTRYILSKINPDGTVTFTEEAYFQNSGGGIATPRFNCITRLGESSTFVALVNDTSSSPYPFSIYSFSVDTVNLTVSELKAVYVSDFYISGGPHKSVKLHYLSDTSGLIIINSEPKIWCFSVDYSGNITLGTPLDITNLTSFINRRIDYMPIDDGKFILSVKQTNSYGNGKAITFIGVNRVGNNLVASIPLEVEALENGMEIRSPAYLGDIWNITYSRYLGSDCSLLTYIDSEGFQSPSGTTQPVGSKIKGIIVRFAGGSAIPELISTNLLMSSKRENKSFNILNWANNSAFMVVELSNSELLFLVNRSYGNSNITEIAYSLVELTDTEVKIKSEGILSEGYYIMNNSTHRTRAAITGVASVMDDNTIIVTANIPPMIQNTSTSIFSLAKIVRSGNRFSITDCSDNLLLYDSYYLSLNQGLSLGESILLNGNLYRPYLITTEGESGDPKPISSPIINFVQINSRSFSEMFVGIYQENGETVIQGIAKVNVELPPGSEVFLGELGDLASVAYGDLYLHFGQTTRKRVIGVSIGNKEIHIPQAVIDNIM